MRIYKTFRQFLEEREFDEASSPDLLRTMIGKSLLGKPIRAELNVLGARQDMLAKDPTKSIQATRKQARTDAEEAAERTQQQAAQQPQTAQSQLAQAQQAQQAQAALKTMRKK